MVDKPTPENLDELKRELESQARQQAAKWIISSIVILVGFAVTGWWFYLQPKIDDYIRNKADGLPSGAVVAFLSSESEPCPGDNWEIYNDVKGRFIVGAGKGDGLTLRELGKSGGEQMHILKGDELPSHNHDIYFSLGEGGAAPLNWFNNAKTNNTVASQSRGPDTGGHQPFVGKNQPHNNMPPYIALYYCKKG